MKRVTILLLLWLAVCLLALISPKIVSKFTPKIKEVYINRVITKEVIKEKIVYTPLENSIFKIERIQEPPNAAYKVEFLREFPGGCMIFGGKNQGRDFYLSVSDIAGYNHRHPVPELREKEEPKKEEAIYGQSYPVIIQGNGQQVYEYYGNTVSAPTVVMRRLNAE